MAYVDWMIKGPELATCNCDWGCPCQFNALPTRGDCRAVIALRIDEALSDSAGWEGPRAPPPRPGPPPIKEGQAGVWGIDKGRANPKHRGAILKTPGGQKTNPSATIFPAAAARGEPFHEPMLKP